MKSITVFVMLDACRHDYIHKLNTPFLYQLTSSGFFSTVKPTFGFEPDAAYLAGLWPDKADGGAQFWYSPEESPFRVVKFLPSFLNSLPDLPQKVIRKLLIKGARHQCSSPNLSTAKIPFHLLANFALPVKHGLDHQKFCAENKTIFNLLQGDNKKWLFHAAPEFRVNIKTAVKRAEKDMKAPAEFAFFHIGNLDGVGHRYGPDSPEISDALKYVDNGLKQIFTMANNRFDKVNFVVMGDHGMIRVKKTVNIESVLACLSISQGRDFLYMLDSTMARFWFFSDDAREQVTTRLQSVEGGRILDQKDKDRYHINYNHNKFGDLIFLSDPGYLIFPNHYQDKSPVRGMHGYTPESYGQQAALIIKSNKAVRHPDREFVDMRQVFPTLCDLLGIRIPDNCDLKSLVKP